MSKCKCIYTDKKETHQHSTSEWLFEGLFLVMVTVLYVFLIFYSIYENIYISIYNFTKIEYNIFIYINKYFKNTSNNTFAYSRHKQKKVRDLQITFRNLN